MSYSIFTPMAATKKIAASTSAADVALAMGNDLISREVRVYNDLNEVVFIKFGTATGDDAAVTDLPIGPLATEIFTISSVFTYVSAITASGSGNIYFTEGRGA